MNRHVISNVSELRSDIAHLKSGDPAVLLVERDGHLIYLALQFD